MGAGIHTRAVACTAASTATAAPAAKLPSDAAQCAASSTADGGVASLLRADVHNSLAPAPAAIAAGAAHARVRCMAAAGGADDGAVLQPDEVVLTILSAAKPAAPAAAGGPLRGADREACARVLCWIGVAWHRRMQALRLVLAPAGLQQRPRLSTLPPLPGRRGEAAPEAEERGDVAHACHDDFGPKDVHRHAGAAPGSCGTLSGIDTMNTVRAVPRCSGTSASAAQ
mmetsp:Transcript_75307/g.217549  ORF Transcript_75307/g.217549 Transcript_75307/m.217549 type:complete len:227 (+) Transcript_75307:393-1073(+)